ncbi:uncharacterized protein ASCRUDRAFT_32293, partial [Ascoidea rubescens DSM 1968]
NKKNVTFLSELKVLTHYSIPLIITFLLEQIFSIVCTISVGRLGKNELGACSLASMTATITLAIFEGIATSLDTLCPQAYGAGKYNYVGIHIQRSFFFSLFLFIPFAFLWWNSRIFLLFLIPFEDDSNLIDLTVLFLRILIIGVPPYIGFENFKRFLQAQGIFEITTYILFICAPINVFLTWFLVWHSKFGLGYIGAPIATVINFWLMFILLILYIIFIDGKLCWDGFTLKAFQNWDTLLNFAIPGVIMLEAENLSYEVLTLLASYFGTAELAAQSAASTVASLTYMMPFAVGIASSTRVANFIGAKKANQSKISCKVGIVSSIFIGLLNCSILYFSRFQLASVFSKDDQVKSLITNIFPLISVIQIFDSINSVSGSILRGQGQQIKGCIINFSIYYFVAIPLSVMFAFYFDWQLIGLWLGIGIGLFLIAAIQSWFAMNVDWEMLVSKACERNELKFT